MPRPKSKGLEYFSHDTDMTDDEKLQFIEAEHGLIGYAVYNKLLEIIYRKEGYYMPFTDRLAMLYAKNFGIDSEKLVSVIKSCVKEDLFSDNLYSRYAILTSERIQANYVMGCEKRTECRFFKEYLLIIPHEIKGQKSRTEIIIDVLQNVLISEETIVSDTKTIVSDTITRITGGSSTQSKVKYSNKEIKKENPEFERFRILYPGTTRGFQTEFENFKKKHKDWKLVLPKLYDILVAQISSREQEEKSGVFVPDWQHLKTWINQRSWEREIKKTLNGSSLHTDYKVSPTDFWGTKIEQK